MDADSRTRIPRVHTVSSHRRWRGDTGSSIRSLSFVIEEAWLIEVKDAGPFERILTFTLDETAIATGKRKAAARLSKDSKIKGFRPGKAPLKVVESMVGAEVFRKEAIDDAIPAALASAIVEAKLSPVVYPRLEAVRDAEGGVEVDVLITLWPQVDALPAYAGRRVTIERPEVTDADVDDQIQRMRDQFAELEDVSREAFDGDFVLIDMKTTLDGAEFAAGSANDMLYEIGSDSLLEGMDDAVRGSGAGAIARFESVLPVAFGEAGGKAVTVQTLVKQVKAKRLPEVDDDWVSQVSEFDTVAEMRAELARQMLDIRVRGARGRLADQAVSDAVADLDLVLPGGLVDAEMDSVFHRFAHRLESQGVPFDQYLAVTGQDQGAFLSDLKSQAELNLRTRILLEAVAEREGIEVTPGELEETITALAAASRTPVEEYRKALSEGGQEETLSGDILRRKAADRLAELATPVDPDGNEIELPEVEAPRPAAPDQAVDEGDGSGTAPEDDEQGPEPAEVQE